MAHEAGIMICRYHRGRQPPEQLTITLLTGHHHHPLEGQLPVQSEVTNRLTAGRQPRKNIQIPVAAPLRPSRQPLPPQPLTHVAQHRFIRLTLQITQLPGPLMLFALGF